MAFKRALWHSGLTYKNVCDNCGSIVKYKDDALDFRPWYPDGFVYCPKCKKPLRHNERLAVDAPKVEPETFVINCQNISSSASNDTKLHRFCTSCGKQFNDKDVFCSACGSKR